METIVMATAILYGMGISVSIIIIIALFIRRKKKEKLEDFEKRSN